MIKFDKESHTYTNEEGKNLISVTQLLQLYNLSPDYSAVDEETMRKSAERGTLIHKEIEDYNKRGEVGFTKELGSYISYLSEKGMKCIDSEFIVWDDIVAGTADLLLDENGEKVIADIKTTSSLHKDSVSWQLSLYAYLYEQDHPGEGEIKRGQGFWFDKAGDLQVVDIPLKPREEVERLIQSAKDGTEFKETNPIPVADIARLEEAEALITKYDELKKTAQKQADTIRCAIISGMEKASVYSFENDRMKVTYIAPSTRTTIDSAKLKAEKPDIYKAYSKTTPTKAGLRVTMKKVED
jgi:hypothetical protein